MANFSSVDAEFQRGGRERIDSGGTEHGGHARDGWPRSYEYKSDDKTSTGII
jgi:hypothetical protein